MGLLRIVPLIGWSDACPVCRTVKCWPVDVTGAPLGLTCSTCGAMFSVQLRRDDKYIGLAWTPEAPPDRSPFDKEAE